MVADVKADTLRQRTARGKAKSAERQAAAREREQQERERAYKSYAEANYLKFMTTVERGMKGAADSGSDVYENCFSTTEHKVAGFQSRLVTEIADKLRKDGFETRVSTSDSPPDESGMALFFATLHVNWRKRA